MYQDYERLRDDRHMKDADVTRETGVTSTTLSEWKAGKYTPKVDKLIKIARLFNVPLEELVREEAG